MSLDIILSFIDAGQLLEPLDFLAFIRLDLLVYLSECVHLRLLSDLPLVLLIGDALLEVVDSLGEHALDDSHHLLALLAFLP